MPTTLTMRAWVPPLWCILFLSSAAAAPTARRWERIKNCTWLGNRWNDGDSFHILTGDKRELVVRLYFVDAPEAETAYIPRLDEQGAYFGINREQATKIAHEAADFTKTQLARPFMIWTRWLWGRGRSNLGRRYCLVITGDGRDLNELLIENGLARIEGETTPPPDGRRTAESYLELKKLERKVKREKVGGWRF